MNVVLNYTGLRKSLLLTKFLSGNILTQNDGVSRSWNPSNTKTMLISGGALWTPREQSFFTRTEMAVTLMLYCIKDIGHRVVSFLGSVAKRLLPKQQSLSRLPVWYLRILQLRSCKRYCIGQEPATYFNDCSVFSGSTNGRKKSVYSGLADKYYPYLFLWRTSDYFTRICNRSYLLICLSFFEN